MAKPKYQEPEKIKGGELLDLRVTLKGHLVWSSEQGRVVTQYTDGSVMVKTITGFHTKAKPGEFQICLWYNRNIPIKPIKDVSK